MEAGLRWQLLLEWAFSAMCGTMAAGQSVLTPAPARYVKEHFSVRLVWEGRRFSRSSELTQWMSTPVQLEQI